MPIANNVDNIFIDKLNYLLKATLNGPNADPIYLGYHPNQIFFFHFTLLVGIHIPMYKIILDSVYALELN
jgi:hypothetical protein